MCTKLEKLRKYYVDVDVTEKLVNQVEQEVERIAASYGVTDYSTVARRCAGRTDQYARSKLVPAALCELDARRFHKHGIEARLLGSLVNEKGLNAPQSGFFIHAAMIGVARCRSVDGSDFLTDQRRKCYEWHSKARKTDPEPGDAA